MKKKTGLLRETIGTITLSLRVFDPATLDQLSTILDNEPGYIKEAINETIFDAVENVEKYRQFEENWMWDGVTTIQGVDDPNLDGGA